MFDGFDCCGYDDTNDGDYDDLFEIAPGDTSFCTECLCKGMHKFKKSCSTGQKQTKNHYPEHLKEILRLVTFDFVFW